MSIAFTTGDPSGIGPDLAVIYSQRNDRENLLFFTDPDLLIERAKILQLPLNIIDSPSSSKPGDVCVYPVYTKVKSNCGLLNAKNSEYVLEMLNEATNHCINSKSEALVTGPLHKGIINKAGIDFTGHTEYLSQLTNTNKTVMMLATDGLRVALATTHLPLRDVPSNISTESLKDTIKIINDSMINFGINNPTILVCGLNPHAGEGGYLGTEEVEIIDPLINNLNKQDYNLIGSVPADTAFTPDSLKGVDVVLSMYHDQGLPVLKTLGFKNAVNITLGLPFIRTSVDHGTALHLAGTGNISLGSLETSIRYAKMLINNA
ncbi:MAG: 4-hydroxythreonine-4-phosphate dehydrogenase PdxA [Gammaproteobacteria bacterium]|nr:4-hydroxythreonine-4-phosphate dehydrogenase PdxA [Gammaproteobacteria bacterium]